MAHDNNAASNPYLPCGAWPQAQPQVQNQHQTQQAPHLHQQQAPNPLQQPQQQFSSQPYQPTSAMPFPLPQLNTSSHSSQPPVMPNMALPPELQGLNLTPQQIGALFSHFQAQSAPSPYGLPPPPPPQFGTAFASCSVHTPPAHLAPPLPEREDGELSDVGQRSMSGQHSNTGFRKRKLVSSHDDQRNVSQRSSEYDSTQTNGHRHLRSNVVDQAPSQPVANASPTTNKSGDDDKALVLPFMAAMNQQGVAFKDFVQEGLDPTLLGRLYQELRIPIALSEEKGDASAPLVASSKTAATVNAPTLTLQPKAANPEPVKTSSVVATKAAPAAPVDRQSYLARLQAAKSKKMSASSPKTTAPASVVESAAPTSLSNTISTEIPKVPTAPALQPPVEPRAPLPPVSVIPNVAPVKEQSASRASDAATELVRKKMEALKSMKRRMAPQPPTLQPPAPSPTPTAQMPPATSLSPEKTESETLPKPGATSSRASIASKSSLPMAGIPGLFMTATSPAPAGATDSNVLPLASARSVPSLDTSSSFSRPADTLSASDHSRSTPQLQRRPTETDKVRTAPEVSRYKRPFGRSRQNSSDDAMIIEVSDDEGGAGDDDMEIQEKTLLTAANALPASIRQSNIRDLPPLRDFPQRPTISKISAFQGTPTPTGTPGTSSDAEELKRKELEINTLQLRIQEFERRKKAVKAKTPSTEPLPETPSATVTLPGLAATPISQPEPAKPDAMLNKRSKLRADISASDALLSSRQSQMMELQRQMAELQKQNEEDERKKEALREELEALDVNTDGMTHVQMQARKNEIDAQTQKAQAQESETHATASSSSLQGSQVATGTEINSESLSEEGQISDDVDMANDSTDVEANSMPRNILAQPSLEAQLNTTANTGLAGPLEGEDEDFAMSESMDEDDSDAEMEPARLFVGNLPFSTTDHELSTLFAGFDIHSVDLPLRGKKPTGFAFVIISPAQAAAAIERLNGSMLSGRKVTVQMARPKDAAVQGPILAALPEDHNLAEDASSSDDEMDTSDSSSDTSEDDYDNNSTQAMENTTEAAASGPVGTRTQTPVTDNRESEDDEESEMDLDSSDSSDSDEDFDPAPAIALDVPSLPLEDAAKSQSANNHAHLNNTNDATVEPQAGTHGEMALGASHHASSVPWPQFEEYESPLKMFKKYRFHPDYLKNVLGGYHSLTYSHRIRQDVPLCMFESAGGICRDQACDGQHWRDMVISDDQLLIQLGTNNANPGQTKENITRYNIGLKGVIQQLRQEETSDTEIVGARISQYRRQFLEDATVVVTR